MPGGIWEAAYSKVEWLSKIQKFGKIWEVVEDGYQEQEQASLSGNQLKQYKEIIKKDANHKYIDCPKKNENEVNFSESKDGEQVFYTCGNAQKDDGVWYVDSGCSNHMTGIKENFISMDERFKSKVKLGNGKFVKVEGKGEIDVRTKKGSSKFITDVLYVPSLSQNLLSVGQLNQKGYKLNFDENCCMIIDKKNDQVIATIKMAPNKVFSLSMEHKEDLYLNAAENMDEFMLWHCRYGHLNYQSLKELNKKDMVIGLPSIQSSNGACERCVYGKMHRLPFPTLAWRAKFPLELIFGDRREHLHSDVDEKLDEKGEKYIFMGYSDESKGYRLYRPETKELIVSRDVIFDETKAWNWNKNMTQVQPIFEEFGSVRQDGQGYEQINIRPEFFPYQTTTFRYCLTDGSLPEGSVKRARAKREQEASQRAS
ncbi:hypothetical protein RJ639_007337 [Escallonia herrerae]|uniref:GAG-pre-integrase domain-containing protein n=1 Tax=Escallonia herrerae TaxID=1293975 RepID=A0AA89AVI4_9ASTE|nr:hypothetical protein RJ639_007337 [Escallonia herrerae]